MTTPRAVLFYVRSSFLVSPQYGGLVPAHSSILSHVCRHQRYSPRHFSSSVRFFRKQSGRDSFGTRLRRALEETKIRWYPIPVGLGIGFLALVQFYRVNQREKARQRDDEEDDDTEGWPKTRKRIRPTGPWFVYWTSLPCCALTIGKAGPGHVHTSAEGYVEIMGSI